MRLFRAVEVRSKERLRYPFAGDALDRDNTMNRSIASPIRCFILLCETVAMRKFTEHRIPEEGLIRTNDASRT